MRSQITNNFAWRLAIVFSVVILIFSSCGKRNDNNWVYYDETRCSDRWEFSINNEKLKENITTYFDGLGVRIYELEIFNDRTPDSCTECQCKTGRRVKAKIKGRDLSAIKSEGFYQ